MNQSRFILHVDMDAFYASVEIREQPALANRPVAVGGALRSRGVVSAANYVARKYGVHSAMPMARAVRLCPELVCLPVRMNLYVGVSRQIREIFERYTPTIEPLSLDEAFLDVTESIRLFGPVVEIAKQIKQAIWDELGLVASVGIAPNKYLAKIASDIDKPDGFVEIKPEGIQAFLDPLPASRVWGVGKATNAELQRLGIHTMAQLRRQPKEFLVDRFGKFGQHLWELVRGIDNRPVVTDSAAKSISNETTFSIDIRETSVLESWLMDLTEHVARRLRAHERYARTIHLKLRFADFRTITRSRTIPKASQTTQAIWQIARDLLREAREESRKPIRLIGVGVSQLCDNEVEAVFQPDLFSAPEVEPGKQRHIDALADEIQSRFGPASLKRGTGVKH